VARFTISAALLAAIVAGCGDQPEDHTPAFLRCLQAPGGQRVTAAAQLGDFPTRDLLQGSGASLDSISYYTIDGAAARGDARVALVFVEDPRDEVGTSPMPEPAVLLAHVRKGRADARDVVLMPALDDPETTIGDCSEQAAPGEIYP
jgi:hypothetical protein